MTQHPSTRRAFIRLAGLVAGGGLLAACSPSAPPAAPATQAPAAAPKPASATAAPRAAATTVQAAAAPTTFKEAPSLAQDVQAGKLPPIAQRLPANPLVLSPV